MTESSLFVLDMVAAYRQTLDGRLLECNDACARMLGYSSGAELMAAGRIEYCNPSDALSLSAALHDLQSLDNVEVALRARDGRKLWALQNMRLVSVDEASKVWVEAAMFDVTSQRSATQQLERASYNDGLTGLPNRVLSTDRINVALARAKRTHRPVVVMLVDLDHFEMVNATFGHAIGDQLLKAAAERLSDGVREEDTVGRLGSDEFLVVLGEVAADTDAAIAAQRLLDSLSRQFVIDSHTIDLKASIGIAVTPHDGLTSEVLVKNATSAMYQAKERGRNTFRFHVTEINARAIERASLVASLRRALSRNEFELHYHPEVNVQTGRIDCIEALLRWRHPDLGLIAPADFIPAAEQGNLDGLIGEWVLAEACRQARAWHDEGMPGIRMAVNLSARQFNDRGLARALEEAIGACRVDPSAIELEIAEPSLARSSRMKSTIEELKEIGVRIAIDNFGSGGCSFTELRDLPVDTIKIAPDFIQNMLHRSDDAALVQAIITVGRGLDKRIVAEGVESREQMRYLVDRRCTEMQGFFFGKPLPAFALADTLRMQH